MTPTASRLLLQIRDSLYNGSWSAFASDLRSRLAETPKINHALRQRIADDLRFVEDRIMREIGVGVR